MSISTCREDIVMYLSLPVVIMRTQNRAQNGSQSIRANTNL